MNSTAYKRINLADLVPFGLLDIVGEDTSFYHENKFMIRGVSQPQITWKTLFDCYPPFRGSKYYRVVEEARPDTPPMVTYKINSIDMCMLLDSILDESDGQVGAEIMRELESYIVEE